MDAAELRKGNKFYIKHNAPNDFEVATIVEIGSEVSIVSFENRLSDHILNEYLLPIPLTAKWHNKFGVKKNGFGSFEYDTSPFNDKARVFIFTGDYLMLRDMSGDNRMEDDLITLWNKDLMKEFYVHEWQNLYRDLTRKELQLKTKRKK